MFLFYYGHDTNLGYVDVGRVEARGSQSGEFVGGSSRYIRVDGKKRQEIVMKKRAPDILFMR
jgi:hypothetical protein